MIHKVDQGSEAWFEAKLGLASASHAHEILSASSTIGYKKYVTQVALERVTGKRTETYKNDFMQAGNDNEPVARLLYSLHFDPVEEAGFFTHDKIQAGASPDGLVKNGLIEIKTQLPHIHLPCLLDSSIDSKYRKQMDMQMWITGREWVDFVSYSPLLDDNDLNFAVIRYERDESKIRKITEATVSFLKDVKSLEDRLRGRK